MFGFGFRLLLCIGCWVLIMLGIGMVCVQVHLSDYSGIVELGGLLSKFSALISVKNQVNLFACSV